MTTTTTMTKTARLHAAWVRLAALLALLLVMGVLAPYAGAQTTSVTFFHNDVLGSPAVATDANGAVVWKESYLPYGHRLQAPVAGANNKLWYAGKQLDPNTGLSYMGARYYSPVVGRFMGMDPKGIVPEDPHSFNRYAYANNNPYKYADPDGRAALLAYKLLVTAAAATGATIYMTPERQAQMGHAATLLRQRTGEALERASGLVFNESESSIPPEVTDKIPPEWGEGKSNRKGDGTRWQDPNDKGSGVRVDEGNPSNSQPSQQVDHVVVRDKGVVIGRDGKPINGSIKQDPANAHIPLSEYKNWRSWNKP